MWRRAFARLALAQACAGLCLAGQQRPAVYGPQVVTFFSEVDGTDQPYALYVPPSFDPQTRYPLVISLHGADSTHRLNLRRVFGLGNRRTESDFEAATRPFPQFPNVDFIVAAPLARGTMGYQGIAEKDVYDVLADVKSRFPIDEDRIYLTGLDMGGGGALRLALTRPSLWAAVAALCPDIPPGIDELAPNAWGLPVLLAHGSLDPLIPPASIRSWGDRLQAAGARLEHIEFPHLKHNVWDQVYRGGAIFRWFARQRRQRWPERVRLVARSYAYRSSYWVEIDALRTGELASIDAQFTAPNAIVVRTAAVDGFSLRLAGHPLYEARRPVIVEADGEKLKAPAGDPLSFRKVDGHWRTERYVHPEGAKQPGSEGPIARAVERRHLYVYGTADSPDEEEQRRRVRQAERAADWSTPERRLLLSLPVVPDSAVTEADARSADLVLFGARATNSVIARLADHLPLELNPSAADYGLVFIAPHAGRYLLVNSGLPWWTGAAPAFSTPAQVLQTFSDYVLFKGSLSKILVQGCFDANWRVPVGDVEKLKATGVVKIR